MKFKLIDTYRYWWPVTVSIPDEKKPGKFVKQTLQIEFESIPQDEAVAAQQDYDKLTKSSERIEHEREQLLKAVKDWKGVEGPDGDDLPFSEDVFRAALQHPWFRIALYSAQGDSLNGRAAAAGN